MLVGLRSIIGLRWVRITIVQTVVRRHHLLVSVEAALLFLSETSPTRARVLLFKHKLLEQIPVHLALRLNVFLRWLLYHFVRVAIRCVPFILGIQVIQQKLSPWLFALHKIKHRELSSFLRLLLLGKILLWNLAVRLVIIYLLLLDNETSLLCDWFKRYNSNLLKMPLHRLNTSIDQDL